MSNQENIVYLSGLSTGIVVECWGLDYNIQDTVVHDSNIVGKIGYYVNLDLYLSEWPQGTVDSNAFQIGEKDITNSLLRRTESYYRIISKEEYDSNKWSNWTKYFQVARLNSSNNFDTIKHDITYYSSKPSSSNYLYDYSQVLNLKQLYVIDQTLYQNFSSFSECLSAMVDIAEIVKTKVNNSFTSFNYDYEILILENTLIYDGGSEYEQLLGGNEDLYDLYKYFKNQGLYNTTGSNFVVYFSPLYFDVFGKASKFGYYSRIGGMGVVGDGTLSLDTFWADVVIHELGHNLGLPHSWGDSANWNKVFTGLTTSGIDNISRIGLRPSDGSSFNNGEFFVSYSAETPGKSSIMSFGIDPAPAFGGPYNAVSLLEDGYHPYSGSSFYVDYPTNTVETGVQFTNRGASYTSVGGVETRNYSGLNLNLISFISDGEFAPGEITGATLYFTEYSGLEYYRLNMFDRPYGSQDIITWTDEMTYKIYFYNNTTNEKGSIIYGKYDSYNSPPETSFGITLSVQTNISSGTIDSNIDYDDLSNFGLRVEYESGVLQNDNCNVLLELSDLTLRLKTSGGTFDRKPRSFNNVFTGDTKVSHPGTFIPTADVFNTYEVAGTEPFIKGIHRSEYERVSDYDINQDFINKLYIFHGYEYVYPLDYTGDTRTIKMSQIDLDTQEEKIFTLPSVPYGYFDNNKITNITMSKNYLYVLNSFISEGGYTTVEIPGYPPYNSPNSGYCINRKFEITDKKDISFNNLSISNNVILNETSPNLCYIGVNTYYQPIDDSTMVFYTSGGDAIFSADTRGGQEISIVSRNLSSSSPDRLNSSVEGVRSFYISNFNTVVDGTVKYVISIVGDSLTGYYLNQYTDNITSSKLNVSFSLTKDNYEFLNDLYDESHPIFEIFAYDWGNGLVFNSILRLGSAKKLQIISFDGISETSEYGDGYRYVINDINLRYEKIFSSEEKLFSANFPNKNRNLIIDNSSIYYLSGLSSNIIYSISESDYKGSSINYGDYVTGYTYTKYNRAPLHQYVNNQLVANSEIYYKVVTLDDIQNDPVRYLGYYLPSTNAPLPIYSGDSLGINTNIPYGAIDYDFTIISEPSSVPTNNFTGTIKIYCLILKNDIYVPLESTLEIEMERYEQNMIVLSSYLEDFVSNAGYGFNIQVDYEFIDNNSDIVNPDGNLVSYEGRQIEGWAELFAQRLGGSPYSYNGYHIFCIFKNLSGYGGKGMLPGFVFEVSIDYLSYEVGNITNAKQTFLHELGHNLGCLHSFVNTWKELYSDIPHFYLDHTAYNSVGSFGDYINGDQDINQIPYWGEYTGYYSASTACMGYRKYNTFSYNGPDYAQLQLETLIYDEIEGVDTSNYGTTMYGIRSLNLDYNTNIIYFDFLNDYEIGIDTIDTIKIDYYGGVNDPKYIDTIKIVDGDDLSKTYTIMSQNSGSGYKSTTIDFSSISSIYDHYNQRKFGLEFKRVFNTSWVDDGLSYNPWFMERQSVKLTFNLIDGSSVEKLPKNCFTVTPDKNNINLYTTFTRRSIYYNSYELGIIRDTLNYRFYNYFNLP